MTDEETASCSSWVKIRWRLERAVERHPVQLKPANVVNSTKLVLTWVDDFRDGSLHHRLIVKWMLRSQTDFTWQMSIGAGIQCQVWISYCSIWQEPNHISSVLAALSWNLCKTHHKLMSLIQWHIVNRYAHICLFVVGMKTMADLMFVEDWRDIICIQDEEDRVEHRALWNTAGDWYRTWHHVIDTEGLSLVG